MTISYNCFNNPLELDFGSNKKEVYIYDGSGEKLYRRITDGSNPSVYTDYIGMIVRGNVGSGSSSLKYIITPEGRIVNSGSDTSPIWSWEYNLKDHLGNVRSVITPGSVEGSSKVLQQTHYYPYGMRMSQISTTEGTGNDYLFGGKQYQEDFGLNWYDFGARFYDPCGRLGFTTIDPIADLDFNFSPYNYCLNNPVNLLDPNGLSTHTDSTGAVIAVYNDGDNSVYKHNTLPESYAQDNSGIKYEKVKDEKGKEKKVATNKLTGGKSMGKTEYWNEFVNPETGKVLTENTIQFGKSFDPIINEMSALAEGMDLKGIAAQSGAGGLFDIKAKYNNVGGLLNGKYATSRSAGNYLAGYNAEGGTYFGIGISFDTFQKLAGALHVKGSLSNKEKAGKIIRGTEYGPPPAYGEQMYQYRMSKMGWNASKNR